MLIVKSKEQRTKERLILTYIKGKNIIPFFLIELVNAMIESTIKRLGVKQ